MFLSLGNHQSLLSELQGDPLLFSGTRVWVLPREHESGLPLRLDSKVYLYEGNQSIGYTVHEGYAMEGRATITRGSNIRQINSFHPGLSSSGSFRDNDNTSSFNNYLRFYLSGQRLKMRKSTKRGG